MVSQPRAMRSLRGSLSGTNLELTGDYNQRLIYQAIRTKGPITRNALIELTGLAKPTIASIVRRLLGSDLVVETSRIYGGRGQPAVHLEINPEGCYAVGLRVESDRLALVVVDACGQPVRHTTADLASASGARVNTFVRRQFFEQTRDVRRERIIGLGVAVSGSFTAANDGDPASETGVGLDLLPLSEIAPGLPIYVDSDLAAAAAGESLFGLGAEFQSYYYILMDSSPVGGLVLHQSLYRGAHPGRKKLLFQEVDLRWCREAVEAERSGGLVGGGGETEDAWLRAACDELVPLLISINCMLNPGGVLFGGRFPAGLLERLADRCNALLLELAPEIPSHAGIRPARLGVDATLIGAASLPMRARLFPTGEALLKAPNHAA